MKPVVSKKVQNGERVPYREKASLKGFLKIKKTIRLGWPHLFTFFVHFLLGAIFVPLALKLGVETLAELAYRLSLKHAENFAHIFSGLVDIFRHVQWPLFAVAIAVYWFRCNVKVYNYSFTQSVGVRIRNQLERTKAPICPRCGGTMQMQHFTEKINEQVGEHEERYTEWVGLGDDKYPVQKTEIVADYANVTYRRQYAECQEPHCMYSDKQPTGRDVDLYKFAEMPYKISDTINYAVRTKAKTNMGAGNIHQYAHGISLKGRILICLLMVVICAIGHYSCADFLVQWNELSLFATSLAITEAIVIGCGLLFQLIIHICYWNKISTAPEIKDRTDDSITVVFSDGSELHTHSVRFWENEIKRKNANNPSRKKDK